MPDDAAAGIQQCLIALRQEALGAGLQRTAQFIAAAIYQLDEARGDAVAADMTAPTGRRSRIGRAEAI